MKGAFSLILSEAAWPKQARVATDSEKVVMSSHHRISNNSHCLNDPLPLALWTHRLDYVVLDAVAKVRDDISEIPIFFRRQ
jgi:hypothetical protein